MKSSAAAAATIRARKALMREERMDHPADPAVRPFANATAYGEECRAPRSLVRVERPARDRAVEQAHILRDEALEQLLHRGRVASQQHEAKVALAEAAPLVELGSGHVRGRDKGHAHGRRCPRRARRAARRHVVDCSVRQAAERFARTLHTDSCPSRGRAPVLTRREPRQRAASHSCAEPCEPLIASATGPVRAGTLKDLVPQPAVIAPAGANKRRLSCTCASASTKSRAARAGVLGT